MYSYTIQVKLQVSAIFVNTLTQRYELQNTHQQQKRVPYFNKVMIHKDNPAGWIDQSR